MNNNEITPESILDKYVNFTCEISDTDMAFVVSREDAISAIKEYSKNKSTMKVKIKKLNKAAVIPKYLKNGDAGMDLTAVDKNIDEYGNLVYYTGLSFEIPEGYVGLLFPRSSNSKTDLILTNSVGVIDSGYRGEVLFKFCIYERQFGKNEFKPYNIGDRIGQLIIMPYPQIEFEEVDKLSETERGTGGYGSTGK